MFSPAQIRPSKCNLNHTAFLKLIPCCLFCPYGCIIVGCRKPFIADICNFGYVVTSRSEQHRAIATVYFVTCNEFVATNFCCCPSCAWRCAQQGQEANLKSGACCAHSCWPPPLCLARSAPALPHASMRYQPVRCRRIALSPDAFSQTEKEFMRMYDWTSGS